MLDRNPVECTERVRSEPDCYTRYSFGLFDVRTHCVAPGCEPTPASVDVNAHDDVSVPVVDAGDALVINEQPPRSLPEIDARVASCVPPLINP